MVSDLNINIWKTTALCINISLKITQELNQIKWEWKPLNPANTLDYTLRKL